MRDAEGRGANVLNRFDNDWEIVPKCVMCAAVEDFPLPLLRHYGPFDAFIFTAQDFTSLTFDQNVEHIDYLISSLGTSAIFVDPALAAPVGTPLSDSFDIGGTGHIPSAITDPGSTINVNALAPGPPGTPATVTAGTLGTEP